jgi:hypothetical protein
LDFTAGVSTRGGDCDFVFLPRNAGRIHILVVEEFELPLGLVSVEVDHREHTILVHDERIGQGTSLWSGGESWNLVGFLLISYCVELV